MFHVVLMIYEINHIVFHVVFVLLASQPLSLFSKAKILNFLIDPKDMLNCVEYICIVNTQYEGHGAGPTCLKLGQFWPISSAKNITVSRETSTFFLRNLSHVLTITDFLVFSPAEKNSGETRAEKSVCFPQATSFRACASTRFIERCGLLDQGKF